VAPAAPPAPPAAAQPAAGDEEQVEAAIARYASAVQSRQTSRIQRAYPGITASEVERWERYFQSMDAEGGVRATYAVQSGPEVQGNVASVVFMLTLDYGGSKHPLPMRAILGRSAGGWQLQEVRSLQQ